jgi:D-alanine-D-alanine ligase-like ATP-grasp enzyme
VGARVVGMAVKDRTQLDLHAICLREAARQVGVETEEGLFPRSDGASARWLVLRLPVATWYFRMGVIRRDSTPAGRPGAHVNGAAAFVTADKAATKAALSAAGLSVPPGRVFGPDGEYGAIAFAAGLGRAVCVKPNRGRKGILAFPGCGTPDAIASAFGRVARRYDQVLVEESVAGEVIRFFYVRPRAVAVKISVPANVVGDGASSIQTLIEAKNREREVRAVPGHHPIVIDADLRMTLGATGLSLASVPARGRRVLLRLVSNGAVGADSIACADTIHPSYAREVEGACAAIPGVRICAIDMKVLDRRTPATPRNHWILELNSSPGLLPYHHPWEGPPQDISGAILRHLGTDAR